MEVLHFIFQDLWHFLGTLLLIAVTLPGIAQIIKALRS